MPPRKAAARSSTRQQTILSFKTPPRITKSQTLHPGIKKDAIASKKRAAVSPPPTDVISPPAAAPKVPEPEPVVQSEEELIAVSLDADVIKSYYKDSIIGLRRVPPVHQEDLTLEEKVLRHFDLSSQYGPCIGMSRIDRWRRAKGLEMEPPVEVLSVCLKMEKELGGTVGKDKEAGSGEVKGVGVDRKRDTRKAYIDDFLSTRMARE